MGFKVQKTQCASCIYRRDSALDIKQLEAQIADKYGGFKGHRSCHHSNMHEAEKCLAGDLLRQYGWELTKVPTNIWHASAAQRAEAFLRVIGQWEET